MKNKPHISIVSPVYKAEKIIEELVFEIKKSLAQLNVSYEIILVDDRSPDLSWEKMKKIAADFKNIKCIRLSRNFGQHPAIITGLNYATGDWVVVIDCDLQDQPKEIINLYNKAFEGYDIVFARRIDREDNFIKKTTSKLFSIIYGYLTDSKYNNEIANFGIYNKKVITEVVKMGDSIKSFPLFVNWVGFNSTAIPTIHSGRFEGKSSYTFSKLFNLAFNTIISFSNKPLKIFVKFGMTISVLSFMFGIYTLVQALNGNIEVLGYSSLIISIWFLSGVLITIIGITGIYIGKIFDQTKNRQSYIIDQILN